MKSLVFNQNKWFSNAALLCPYFSTIWTAFLIFWLSFGNRKNQQKSTEIWVGLLNIVHSKLEPAKGIFTNVQEEKDMLCKFLSFFFLRWQYFSTKKFVKKCIDKVEELLTYIPCVCRLVSKLYSKEQIHSFLNF